MRVFTAVWAALSWSDFMITSWPAFGSAFAFSLSSTPRRVASLVIAGRRSSVTSPLAVEMLPFLPRSLPSSTLITAAWARLLAFSQSACTLGRCNSLSAAAGPRLFSSAAASTGAAAWERGGSRSRSCASTSTRANSPSLSFWAIAPRTSSLARSWLEESAQAWSLSSWRFAQTVSEETSIRIVASPNRLQTSTPRFLLIVSLAFFASACPTSVAHSTAKDSRGTRTLRTSRDSTLHGCGRLIPIGR